MADEPRSPFSEYKVYVHWFMAALLVLISSITQRYLGPDVKLPPIPPTLTAQELRDVVREEIKEASIQAGTPKKIGVKP